MEFCQVGSDLVQDNSERGVMMMEVTVPRVLKVRHENKLPLYAQVSRYTFLLSTVRPENTGMYSLCPSESQSVSQSLTRFNAILI